MGTIRIAIAGVGNCCSSLLQGMEFYKQNGFQSLGIIHDTFGGYKPSDIKVVAAFDVTGKVGMDISEAIHAEPNNVPKIIEVPKFGVIVQKGEVKDKTYLLENPAEGILQQNTFQGNISLPVNLPAELGGEPKYETKIVPGTPDPDRGRRQDLFKQHRIYIKL